MIAHVRGISMIGSSAALALALAACVVAGEGDVERAASELGERGEPCWETTLSWGAGAGQVGLVPAASERAARGPQAIAVGNDGEVFVLDNVNGRVLAVDASGAARVAVAEVVAHSEGLAIGPDGAIATYSPLLSAVAIADATGAPAGEVRVSRMLRHVRGISLQSSRRVLVHTAQQETFPVGSPSAPLALPATLHGKREGAAPLGDDRGVSVLATGGGQVELQIVRAGAMTSTATAERRRVLATLPVPGGASAGRVVGATDELACATLERVGNGAPVTVQRRLACLRLASPAGVVVHEEALPAPAIYQPPHPVALGGAPLSVASMQPSDAGLTVRSCSIAAHGSTEVVR